MYRIKICGIVCQEDAIAAAEAGADALGFLAGVTHRAEDMLTLPGARNLIRSIPSGVWPVLVTHLQDAPTIIEYCRTTECRAVQIQDDIDIDVLAGLREELSGLLIIKAVLMDSPDIEELIKRASSYENYVDAFVCDTVNRAEDRIGGTGQIHDWSLSRILTAALDKPVILAGGLNPGNVAEAVRTVGPWGVDVNTGVEKFPRSRSGRKDPQKLRAFIYNARRLLK